MDEDDVYAVNMPLLEKMGEYLSSKVVDRETYKKMFDSQGQREYERIIEEMKKAKQQREAYHQKQQNMAKFKPDPKKINVAQPKKHPLSGPTAEKTFVLGAQWMENFAHRLVKPTVTVTTERLSVTMTSRVTLEVVVDRGTLRADFEIDDKSLVTAWNAGDMLVVEVERMLKTLWGAMCSTPGDPVYDDKEGYEDAVSIVVGVFGATPTSPHVGKAWTPSGKKAEVVEPEPERTTNLPPGAVRLRPPTGSPRRRRRRT